MAKPGPLPTTEPPTAEAISDELANDVLYQEFMNRGGDGPTNETADEPNDEPAAAPDSVEGDPEAPSSPSTVIPVDEPVEEDSEEEVEEEATEPTSAYTHTSPLGPRSFSTDDMDRIIQLADWGGSLTPEQVQQIDAVLSGQYQLVPTSTSPITPAPPVVPSSVATGGAPSSTFTPIPDDDLEDLPVAVRARLDELASAVTSLTASQNTTLTDTQQRREQEAAQRFTEGATRFQATKSLSESESLALQQEVVRLQILPGYINSSNGDFASAMEKAMDAVYWSTPVFRDRELSNQADERKQTQAATTTRKSKASALTSSGGSVPRTSTPPVTKQDRQAAMAKEIAESMSQ